VSGGSFPNERSRSNSALGDEYQGKIQERISEAAMTAQLAFRIRRPLQDLSPKSQRPRACKEQETICAKTGNAGHDSRKMRIAFFLYFGVWVRLADSP
jgi:hypothetical protein